MSEESELTGQDDDAQLAATDPLVPLRFGNIIDLFSRPRRFFSSNLDLGAKWVLAIVILVVGMATQIDRMDTEILRHDLDTARPSWLLLEPIVTGSWLLFWAWVAGFGLVSGSIVYFLGGWWCRMRLRMSGAPEDVDRFLPRQVYVYSTLVTAIPSVLVVIGYSFIYPNYLDGYRADEKISLFLPLFVFWSVLVSYTGVTTCFVLSQWKARFWFLILPMLFYLLVMGFVVALLGFLGDGF